MDIKPTVNILHDYYAFGSSMPGRSFNSSSYRYGFNGYEKDNEVKGSGNSYDMGERLYDPRIGRTPTLDSYFKYYPDISPYSFAGNSPILFTDGDGERIKISDAIVLGQSAVLQILQSVLGKDLTILVNPTSGEIEFSNDGVKGQAELALANFKSAPPKSFQYDPNLLARIELIEKILDDKETYQVSRGTDSDFRVSGERNAPLIRSDGKGGFIIRGEALDQISFLKPKDPTKGSMSKEVT